MPIGALVAWISALSIYFSAISKSFVFFDIIIGIIFAIMTTLQDRISAEIKIFVTILIPIIIGVLSFMDGGFDSAGTTLILISNVMAVMLLPKLKSVIISLVSVGIFIGLWIWATMYQGKVFICAGEAVWSIQFVLFILFLIILQVMVYAIRGYLLKNIEMLEKSAQRTYKLAYYDQLTGLPNQNLFKKQLSERVTEGVQKGFIVFYNLKNLNLINSIYGDTIGDQVLVETANVFSTIKKDSNILARTSGNEFAIWVENISERELVEWLDYIGRVFKCRFLIPNMKKSLEFYISYACYNKDDIEISECYQKASIALTYAKENNKSGIMAYNKTFEEVIRYDENMKELLQSALAEEEFELYYQTKVDAITGEILGVESLARWKSPTLGVIPPSVFIPIIERMNQSVAFGEVIIKKVFMDYERLCSKYHKEIKVSINISPSHLMSEGFVQYLSGKIREYEIGEQKIIIEITEEVIIEGVERVNAILKAIHELGISVSIDDFGTGYSSFNYLMILEVDELKIDKSFIDQLGESDKTSILLESIIYISKGLDFDLVAEGVETREQCDKLLQLGCRIVQGYYFSKPEPIYIDLSKVKNV